MAVRLLLDENLSARLLPALMDVFPGSDHVRTLRLERISDSALWELAGDGDYVLTTREEDLIGTSVLRGTPPKILWLNTGHSRNPVIAALIKSHALDIERFVADAELSFLAIGFYTSASSR
jgi:predicted nuclease of predicted toxin-antitoxin system